MGKGQGNAMEMPFFSVGNCGKLWEIAEVSMEDPLVSNGIMVGYHYITINKY